MRSDLRENRWLFFLLEGKRLICLTFLFPHRDPGSLTFCSAGNHGYDNDVESMLVSLPFAFNFYQKTKHLSLHPKFSSYYTFFFFFIFSHRPCFSVMAPSLSSKRRLNPSPTLSSTISCVVSTLILKNITFESVLNANFKCSGTYCDWKQHEA